MTPIGFFSKLNMLNNAFSPAIEDIPEGHLFKMAATAATDLNIIVLDPLELCQTPLLCY